MLLLALSLHQLRGSYSGISGVKFRFSSAPSQRRRQKPIFPVLVTVTVSCKGTADRLIRSIELNTKCAVTSETKGGFCVALYRSTVHEPRGARRLSPLNRPYVGISDFIPLCCFARFLRGPSTTAWKRTPCRRSLWGRFLKCGVQRQRATANFLS